MSTRVNNKQPNIKFMKAKLSIVLLTHFSHEENGNAERFFNLPKVTQLMDSEKTDLGWVGCLSYT